MKTFNKYFVLILPIILASVILISCERSETNDDQVAPPSATGFFWRENDMNAALKTAGSSELRTQFKSIFAFTGATTSSGTVFEINLSGTAVGTYEIGTAGNALYFNGFGSTSGGKIIITKNDGSKASGTFEASGTGGTASKVYGTFTDIPVK